MTDSTPQLTPTKYCPKCKSIKPIDDFARDKSRRDEHCGHCKACHKEYSQENRLRLIQVSAEWQRNNRSRATAHVHKWRQSNPDKVVQAEKQRFKTNKEANYARGRIRRARIAAAPGHHTPADIKRQYEAQKGHCYYCDCELNGKYETDHVIPISRGGSDGMENIVIACPPCNLSKGDKLPSEWGGSNRLL